MKATHLLTTLALSTFASTALALETPVKPVPAEPAASKEQKGALNVKSMD